MYRKVTRNAQRKMRRESPMRSAHTRLWLAGALLAGALLLWLAHRDWLPHFNATLLGVSPDGFKNYSTLIYHVRHDSLFAEYRGMSYPMGEHVLFTDNQPLLAALLKWYHERIHSLTGREVGIFNIILLLSQLAGVAVYYLLLRRLRVGAWYAAAVSLGVIFLSPQYNRINAHFGLSHPWIIPLLLLLLCKYEESYNRRYQSILIGLLTVASAQLHFYYLGLIALFTSLYMAAQWLRRPTLRNARARLIHLMIMVAIPYALLNFWLHWTHYSTFRPKHVLGIGDYIGYLDAIFLPYKGMPLHDWISRTFTPIAQRDYEAWSYVGVVGFLFTVAALFSGLRVLTRSQSWESKTYSRIHINYLRSLFFASVVLTAYACGVPYAIKGLEWTLEYLGPLKQFRSQGRFVWAFYYVINLLAFYAIWRWHKRLRQNKRLSVRIGAWALLFLPLLVLAYEATIFQQWRNKEPRWRNLFSAATLNTEEDQWLHKLDFSRYQALLPMPYYHAGSECFNFSMDYNNFTRMQAASVMHGIPDMGNFLSRTPLDQTLHSIQLILKPCQPPRIFSLMTDTRPIAVVCEAKDWDWFRGQYPHLLSEAPIVYSDPTVKVAELRPEYVENYRRARTDEADERINSGQLARKGAWLVENADLPLLYEGFDTHGGSKVVFQGDGALCGIMSDTVTLWRGNLASLGAAQGELRLSIWIHASHNGAMTHHINFVHRDKNTGAIRSELTHGLLWHPKAVLEDWVLFDVPFNVDTAPETETHIFLYKKNRPHPFCADEMLIYHPDGQNYMLRDKHVVHNNIWYVR